MKIGAVLRAAREQADISQAGLARRIGISAAQLSQLESGERSDPRFTTILKIASGLGLSLDTIAVACGFPQFKRQSSGDRARKEALLVKSADEVNAIERNLLRTTKRIQTLAKNLRQSHDH